jgi:plastocyanin
VEIKNFAFNPETIKIKVGDTVRWTNKDSVAHTATADDGSFDTGYLSYEQSKSITFNESRIYYYYCIPHPWMKGTIIVE